MSEKTPVELELDDARDEFDSLVGLHHQQQKRLSEIKKALDKFPITNGQRNALNAEYWSITDEEVANKQARTAADERHKLAWNAFRTTRA